MQLMHARCVAIPPDVGAMDDLRSITRVDLVRIVKAVQRENLAGPDGTWGEYVAAKLPKLKFADPSRHQKEPLLAFLEGVVAQCDKQGTESGTKLIQRWVKWFKWQQKNTHSPVAVTIPSGKSSDEIPKGSMAELTWQLVARTRANPRYSDDYDLPSHGKGWCLTKTSKKAADLTSPEPPRMFALDCEMVRTDLEPSSLVGLCLVDETGQPVYKQLVRPRGQVLDWKTSVTGLGPKDLEGVTTTREEARKAVKRLLQEHNALLVGHSLHNDLKAMRLDHRNVIDTAYVFRYKGLPMASPGLKDLAKTLLNKDMREGETGHHDSFEDAAVTMQLVQLELANGCQTGPLQPPNIKVPKEDLCKLLVHGINKRAEESDIRDAFGGPDAPTGSFIVEGELAQRKVLLVFKDATTANQGFKMLQGTEAADSVGRASKIVTMAKGGRITVRKMACHNGAAFGRDKVAEKVLAARLAGIARKAARAEKAKTGAKTKALKHAKKQAIQSAKSEGGTTASAATAATGKKRKAENGTGEGGVSSPGFYRPKKKAAKAK